MMKNHESSNEFLKEIHLKMDSTKKNLILKVRIVRIVTQKL